MRTHGDDIDNTMRIEREEKRTRIKREKNVKEQTWMEMGREYEFEWECEQWNNNEMTIRSICKRRRQ